MNLSILIPARNEKYLQKTIDDIEAHAETDIQILTEEDTGLGQRGLTTKLALEATGDYLMKTDGHCSFSQGFDRIMLERIDERTILAPILMPLNGDSWTINGKKQMTKFAFGTDFVMQHQDATEDEDSMCLQGSCFMVSRDNYFKWNLGDPDMPSWGGQAVELGIKAFLNGGRCRVTKDAYYGHVFRTADSDFPYERGEHPGKLATETLIKKFKNKSLAPLIEKFGYPLDWTPEIVAAML